MKILSVNAERAMHLQTAVGVNVDSVWWTAYVNVSTIIV